MSLSRETRTAGAALTTYFDELREVFSGAAHRLTRHACTFALAGETVRLNFAGERLIQVLTPAFAHLPPSTSRPSLDIHCWEGAETGCELPRPPWAWPDKANFTRLDVGDARFYVSMTADANAFTFFRHDTGQAFFWVRDARALQTYHYGSPLVNLISWWSQQRDLLLVHAGCVGRRKGGVLFAGRGGAGKSTTALLCLQAGMNYVSDDYCLLKLARVPTAHSIYNSGKLHRQHLPRFPSLAAKAVDPVADQYEKPVIFVHRHFPGQMAESLPLKAVVVPTITGELETHVQPATPAEALRALAPSTVFQLSHPGPAAFHQMAQLVRMLPCFRLRLGSRLDGIAPALESLLAELNG